MSEAEIKTKTVHCNQCGRNTEHKILHEADCSVTEDFDGNSVTAYEWNRLLICAGCKAVSMERITGHSEDWDPETGHNYSEEYFPPRTYRPAPRWLEKSTIPAYVGKSLAEIYVAVQNDLRSLASMGIRALLESLMIKKVGDQGTFKQNLDAFADAGHVSRTQRDMFESTLEVGHAVMHRGFVPSSDGLVACLDATEHVVQSLYVFPSQSAALRKAVPRRKKRRKVAKKTSQNLQGSK
jgi:hypothetical protein